MTGTGGGVIMLVGGGLMGTFGALLFANRNGYTQQYVEDQRLWTRDQPVSEVRVALMRVMGLLLAVAGAGVFVAGLVLTIRGQGHLLLRQEASPLWTRVPPLIITASALGQLVQAHRRREAPWTGRRWASATVLAVGAVGFALACWWGYIAVAVVVIAVTLVAFFLLSRAARTAERPRSPEDEGEQGRSES
ncbi:hypothetical protein [Streptacidiphilus jiangxiensis]|uniref:Uncharacterized protein n=1 Tax=Streptacidiphilus jiangxiensis TaxID=235985 RepID=A0A1H7KYH5_STRJI|nr:hypothetical protein [Streptacidiphilus jiangxiensis]SEK91556.1 hypothetical protein SAMN05414137_104251 [Streptacidiphilus jiangxiensis]